MTTAAVLHTLRITDLAARLGSRRLRSRALVDAYLERIARFDGELNAYILVDGDRARADATRADAELDAKPARGPLHGIPLSVKDLIDVEGLPTTAGSRVRSDHTAASDAPVIANLRAAGAIVIGKCNLHEFAFGTTGEDSAWGPTRNPYDRSRSPGGSSGGSAAAVAAGLCAASIGTDTGGSVRIPAAACGVVGLKPGRDELSCRGVVPLSTSLDHVGPLARSVADARMLFLAMSGRPIEAPTPDPRPVPLRLGVPRRYFLDRLDDDVRRVFGESTDRLRRAGVTFRDVDVPHADAIAAIYLVIVLSEAAAFHGPTLTSRAADYTQNVRLRLEAGRYIPAEDYVRARSGCEVLRREVDATLQDVDALLLPTLPIPAPLLGRDHVEIGSSADSVRALTLRLTQLFNLTGHPAVTIPCGVTVSGLPCGVQLVGRTRGTAALLDLADRCEAVFAGAVPAPQLPAD